MQLYVELNGSMKLKVTINLCVHPVGAYNGNVCVAGGVCVHMILTCELDVKVQL